MTTTLDDEPTLGQVLAVIDDDVVPMLDSASGALYTRRDSLDHDSSEAESLCAAAELLATAWANAKRAAEIIHDDLPIDLWPAQPIDRLRVQRIGRLWYVVNAAGVYLAFEHTQGKAIDLAHDIARRRAA